MTDDPKRPTEDREQSPLALAGLGAQFFAALLIFAYGGLWLDRRFGTAPLFLLLGVFVGGGGSFFIAVRRITGAQRGGKA